MEMLENLISDWSRILRLLFRLGLEKLLVLSELQPAFVDGVTVLSCLYRWYQRCLGTIDKDRSCIGLLVVKKSYWLIELLNMTAKASSRWPQSKRFHRMEIIFSGEVGSHSSFSKVKTDFSEWMGACLGIFWTAFGIALVFCSFELLLELILVDGPSSLS